MTDKELMQQALRALELIDDAMPFPVAKLAIKNLRERLAQPCDLGQICLNCQPRGPNGECPDQQYEHIDPVSRTIIVKFARAIEAHLKENT